MAELFSLYQRAYPEGHVEQSTLEKVWRKLFKGRLADPATEDMCDVEKKKPKTPGFKDCNLCVALALAVKIAITRHAKADAKANTEAHYRRTTQDRLELNRLKDYFRRSETNVGATIDCPDGNKFVTPTTHNKAGIMDSVTKIKNKIHAV